MPMQKRYKTYIENFDEAIEGGIPEGFIVLWAGKPGTLKSSTAYNMLFRNSVDNGIPSVYVTFDINKRSLYAQLKNLGFEEKTEAKLNVLDLMTIRENLSQFKGENWLETFKIFIRNLRYNYKQELFVMDSIQMMELVVRQQNPREEMYRTLEWLRDLDMTTVLISEMYGDMTRFSKYDEEILVDGIVHLDISDTFQRRIRCVKMRGTSHSLTPFELTFSDGRFSANEIAGETTSSPTSSF